MNVTVFEAINITKKYRNEEAACRGKTHGHLRCVRD